jgi:glucokinase
MSKAGGSAVHEKTIAAQNKPVAIGVDIGGTAIKAAFVDSDGNLLESFREESPCTTTGLETFLRKVRASASMPIVGFGIGCKGVIDPVTTRINCLPGDLNFLEGVTLRNLVEMDGLPFCADNDARTALVGEMLWGAARGRRNVLMLTLGTGIGAAALVDGVILRGASGAACHLGHITMDLNGGLCICGKPRVCRDSLLFSRHRVRIFRAHPPGFASPAFHRRSRQSSYSGGHLSGGSR